MNLLPKNLPEKPFIACFTKVFPWGATTSTICKQPSLFTANSYIAKRFLTGLEFYLSFTSLAGPLTTRGSLSVHIACSKILSATSLAICRHASVGNPNLQYPFEDDL
jgi:hypothetical protein